jgi:branched-chain amino acid transport system substrate-binding protein
METIMMRSKLTATLSSPRISALFILSLLLLFPSLSVAQVKPLKIGVVLCLSGGCQQTGTHALNGMMLARDEINSKGGILNRPVELVVQDSREVDSPSYSVSAYRQLRLDREISLFAGPSWSIGGLAIAPIAARDPVIIIAPTVGLEDFNETADNIFCLWPHDSVSTKALAELAIKRGWKRAAVISNTNPWESRLARIFQEEYRRLGGVETDFVEHSSSDATPLRTAAAKIRSSKPDLVFMTNYSQLGLTGRALKEAGVDAAKMTVLLEDPQIDVASGALEGTIFATYSDAETNFVERFKSRFNISPDMGADTGYDIVYLYKNAIERVGSTDPLKLRDAILATEMTGASGPIRFDPKGGVIKTPIFKRLSGKSREVF